MVFCARRVTTVLCHSENLQQRNLLIIDEYSNIREVGAELEIHRRALLQIDKIALIHCECVAAVDCKFDPAVCDVKKFVTGVRQCCGAGFFRRSCNNLPVV